MYCTCFFFCIQSGDDVTYGDEESEDDDYYDDDENYVYEYPDDENSSLSMEETIHPELMYEDDFLEDNKVDKKDESPMVETNEVYPKDSPYTHAGSSSNLVATSRCILALLMTARALLL